MVHKVFCMVLHLQPFPKKGFQRVALHLRATEELPPVYALLALTSNSCRDHPALPGSKSMPASAWRRFVKVVSRSPYGITAQFRCELCFGQETSEVRHAVYAPEAPGMALSMQVYRKPWCGPDWPAV